MATDITERPSLIDVERRNDKYSRTGRLVLLAALWLAATIAALSQLVDGLTNRSQPMPMSPFGIFFLQTVIAATGAGQILWLLSLGPALVVTRLMTGPVSRRHLVATAALWIIGVGTIALSAGSARGPLLVNITLALLSAEGLRLVVTQVLRERRAESFVRAT